MSSNFRRERERERERERDSITERLQRDSIAVYKRAKTQVNLNSYKTVVLQWQHYMW